MAEGISFAKKWIISQDNKRRNIYRTPRQQDFFCGFVLICFLINMDIVVFISGRKKNLIQIPNGFDKKAYHKKIQKSRDRTFQMKKDILKS